MKIQSLSKITIPPIFALALVTVCANPCAGINRKENTGENKENPCARKKNPYAAK